MARDAPRRWSIKTTSDVRAWLRALRQADPVVFRSVNVAIDMLAEIGPALGRPMVDTLHGSTLSNLKELRPRSGRDVAIRVLFVSTRGRRRSCWWPGTKRATGPDGTRQQFRPPKVLTKLGWPKSESGGTTHE